MRKLLLITATLLFGMAADNLYACNTIIKPMAWTITTGEFAGQAFTVTGCMDRIPADGLPIIFAFHGGGESEPHFLGFTDLQTLNALVVAPDGNSSHNGTSWINAFPWMKRNPKNDLELPAALIGEIKLRQADLPKVNYDANYAVGKSDGAGMAMDLACHPKAGIHLLGVAAVSGAYFGLDSTENFGNDNHGICLPASSIPILVMHGTADSVMPYEGQNFINEKALRHARDYWTMIDPAARLDPDNVSCCSNTYTAKVPAYIEKLWHDVQQCSGPSQPLILGGPTSKSTLIKYRNCLSRVWSVTVEGGDHCWFGRKDSGPKACDAPPNLDFGATPLIAEFFGVPH